MTTIHVDGKSYSLCGDFAELVKAETYFGERVSGVNLARAIVNATNRESALAAVRQIFPCSLRKFHPEITWDEAQQLIDRSIVLGYGTIVTSVGRDIFPPVTDETRAANRNLCFDLDALAEANEHFKGEPGLILLLAEVPRLEQVWRVFPCALHRFRSELNLDQCRGLMTLESVMLVMTLIGFLEQTNSEEKMATFSRRVLASSLDQDRTEFAFRVIIAGQQWLGAAKA